MDAGDLTDLFGVLLKGLWAILRGLLTIAETVSDLEFLLDPGFWQVLLALLWAGGGFAAAYASGASTAVSAAAAVAGFLAALALMYLGKEAKEYHYVLWAGSLGNLALMIAVGGRAPVSAH